MLNLILSIVAFLINWTGLCNVCSYAMPPVLSIYVLIKASKSISEIN